MTPPLQAAGNKSVSVADADPPLRYMLSSAMLHMSLVTHAQAREDAQRFGLEHVSLR